MSDIKAVLFDYGGVLAEEGFSNTLEALAKEQNLAVKDMTAEGMQAVYETGYVLGRGSESEFWECLRERTGLRGNDSHLRARVFDGFVIRPWMLELVAQLKARGYITGILSDQTDWLERLDARDHFYQHFDYIYNSYYLGKGKRDPTHFSDIAADLGLDPSAILFVDDKKKNAAMAIATGMQAIHYVDRDSFIKTLKAALEMKLI
jgi:putative hydrolase of the HAD superfamily